MRTPTNRTHQIWLPDVQWMVSIVRPLIAIATNLPLLLCFSIISFLQVVGQHTAKLVRLTAKDPGPVQLAAHAAVSLHYIQDLTVTATAVRTPSSVLWSMNLPPTPVGAHLFSTVI